MTVPIAGATVDRVVERVDVSRDHGDDGLWPASLHHALPR
jgi:hypothetical protein